MNRCGQWLGLVTSENDGHVGAARLDIDDRIDHRDRFLTITSHSGDWACALKLPDNATASENDHARLLSWKGWEPENNPEYLYFGSNGGIDITIKLMSSPINIRLTPADHTVSDLFQDAGVDIEWEEFKRRVLRLERYSHVFRGQGGRWPLRSSLHRKSCWSIHRYISSVLPIVRREIEIFLDRKYSMDDEQGILNFCSLLQHHGFPTPILDWTYSPFIAAFFALQKVSDFDSVQIFVLDKAAFEHAPVKFDMLHENAFVKMGDFAMPPNPRHLPQQSISMATNIDNVAGYFEFVESRLESKIYHVYNIKVVERDRILSELAAMGITAATLFPGLDGICESLRGKIFGNYSSMPNLRLSDLESDVESGIR